MINGVHAVVFSREADKVRAFFADVLGLPAVDAGGGWLIFALPPAELAVHPADGDGHLDALASQFGEGGLDVVTHQVQLVLAVPVGRMYR